MGLINKLFAYIHATKDHMALRSGSIKLSKKIGKLNGSEVRSYAHPSRDLINVYWLNQDNTKIGCYIQLLANMTLKSVRKKITGFSTIELLYWIISQFGKVIIQPDEMLSKDGFSWLSRLISDGYKDLKITDMSGNLISLEELEKEWNMSHGDAHGPTAIVISK